MTRPLYETKENLQGEAAVAQKLAHWINCKEDPSTSLDDLSEVVKTPPRAPYDYCVVKKGLIQFIIEIKLRKIPHNKFPTFMISLEKVATCSLHAAVIGCPFYIVVQWTDKLGFWKFNEKQYTAGIGGREDRNDPLDQEPVIYISINDFVYSKGG